MRNAQNRILNCGHFRVLAVCLLVSAIQFAQAADTSKLTGSVGIDRTSGDYGGTTDTTITIIPFTAKYETGPWLFGLTLPWLMVQGDANVNRDLGRIGGVGVGGTRTASGIGDIVASVTHELGMMADGTAFDLTGQIKFGTADAGKGLGTGENDLRIMVDAYRNVAEFTPFVTLGYKILGDPPGVNLRNAFFAWVGSSMKIDAARSVGLVWYGQQKTSVNGARQSDFTGFYIQKYSPEWKAQYYAVFGFADGSPDIGGGAILTRTF